MRARSLAAATVEHAWAVPELSDREKVFLCVVADVCHPNRAPPLLSSCTSARAWIGGAHSGHPGFAAFHRRYGPGTLTPRERGFAAMSVLRFNVQFGLTRAWRAWKALNAHRAEITR